QLVVRELFGIDCSALIDYDDFDIPWQESFDLIVANHMLTHVVRPQQFFDRVRARLRPGGHLYVYNEFDEREVFSAKKPVLSDLNALHFQVLDADTLVRVLGANGFEVLFVKSYRRAL